MADTLPCLGSDYFGRDNRVGSSPTLTAKGNHMTKKPRDIHAPCETKGCREYFNILYKDTNGKCKRCNRVNEKFNNRRDRQNMEVYHAN